MEAVPIYQGRRCSFGCGFCGSEGLWKRKARKTGDFLKIRLALALHSGEEPSARIGTDMKKEAEALLKTLQQLHPNLQYGKV